MKVDATYARNYIKDIERKLAGNYQDYGFGANVVSDHDESYVFDALFDVPNM